MTDKSNASPTGGPDQLRQGDIWAFPISRADMPHVANPEIMNRVVVAEGEGSGHDHVLEGENMTIYSLANALFADIPEGGWFVHTSEPDVDHERIRIVPGTYVFVRQSDNVGLRSQTRVRD